MRMRLSVLSLGDLLPDPATGVRKSRKERFADLITLGLWAEELGFAGFHLGEHHFCDYIVSNPVPLLAAVAARTSRITLSTGVTLLANRDPVLVAEDYAALDLISDGRAAMIAGRGNAFFECYRQMGQDVAAARATFETNLDLLLRLWREDRVTWDGGTRPALDQASVEPKPDGAHPEIWIGGGSSEDSVRCAVERGLPLQLPGVYGPAAMFAPLADLYRTLWAEKGWAHPAKIGFTAHVHVRKDSQVAKSFWEPYRAGRCPRPSRRARRRPISTRLSRRRCAVRRPRSSIGLRPGMRLWAGSTRCC
jgi:alkanesulfonate monooxygenase SsuD/methylene tetrahydromethanopterin reductase-like flavin-dependent oxidoreductase (luciferase family)